MQMNLNMKSRKGALINIALFMGIFVICIGIAEFALRRIMIEGLSGYKAYMGEIDSKICIAKTRIVFVEGNKYELNLGNCYPSDPTGLLPIKTINTLDSQYWYCVSYNERQRRQGYHPERKRQIAIVGDSFVFGNGVKETDTLGFLLNEYYHGINFQNWGKKGAGTKTVAEECEAITQSKTKVDEVIYFYNLNDVRMSKEASSQQEFIIDFQNVLWSNDEKRHSPFMKLLSKSALLSLIRKEWVLQKESYLTVKNYRDMYLSENNRQEFIETMNDIMFMSDMLAAHGISFRVVIYPIIYKDLLGRYPFENIHAAIIKSCQARGIICLDGYVPFKSYYSMKKFAVHPLDYHPNGFSNRELVNYIYKNNFIKDRQK
jgi:hypothetical protein